MTKSSKSQSHTKKPINFYSIHPWACRHLKDHSEITAYVEISSKWEKVLDVCSTSGSHHETMAGYILSVIHEHQKKQNALHDAMNALQLVLNDGLTFTTEQAMEHAVTNIKKILK